jgi:hypothetical protein
MDVRHGFVTLFHLPVGDKANPSRDEAIPQNQEISRKRASDTED